MKSIILFLLLGAYSISMASNCKLYADKVKYYQDKLLKATDACGVLDATGPLITNLQEARATCTNSDEFNNEIRKIMPLYTSSMKKCLGL